MHGQVRAPAHARWQLEASMHSTLLLRRPPTSDRPVQLHLRARAPLFVFIRGFAAGLGGFAAGTPIVVNKKNCPTSMICVTILRLIAFLFCMTSSPKMQGNRVLREQRRQMPCEEAETHYLRHSGHAFRAKQPRRSISWMRVPAGAYDFLIRCHTHCSSPGVAVTLLIIRDAAGKMGWIQPFGIG